MSIIASLKLIEFRPTAANGPIVGRRRKLADKIAQQISLASDPTYAPTKMVWVKAEDGAQMRREVPKRIKRWWIQNADGTVQLTIRYGSKTLELAKGKNAIECASVADIVTVLSSVKDAVIQGEMDEQLNTVSQYGARLKFKKAG